jgi:hypothetical protein
MQPSISNIQTLASSKPKYKNQKSFSNKNNSNKILSISFHYQMIHHFTPSMIMSISSIANILLENQAKNKILYYIEKQSCRL